MAEKRNPAAGGYTAESYEYDHAEPRDSGKLVSPETRARRDALMADVKAKAKAIKDAKA